MFSFTTLPDAPAGRVLALATFGAIVAACSLTLDANRQQCNVDADCAGHGLERPICREGLCRSAAPIVVPEEDAGPFDPVWGCVGKRAEVPVEKIAKVSVPFKLTDAKGSPRADLPIIACEQDDEACATPVEGSSVTTDADGLVAVPVYSGFTGYFKAVAYPAAPTLMTSYIFLGSTPSKERTPELRQLPLATKEELTQLVADAGSGRTVTPGFAHLRFVAKNCLDQSASGVGVAAEPISKSPFQYYNDAEGRPSVTEQATREDGVGGFGNLPPGNVEFTSRNTETRIVDKRTFFLRADAVHYAVLGPL